jgi:hypothetical protein
MYCWCHIKCQRRSENPMLMYRNVNLNAVSLKANNCTTLYYIHTAASCKDILVLLVGVFSLWGQWSPRKRTFFALWPVAPQHVGTISILHVGMLCSIYAVEKWERKKEKLTVNKEISSLLSFHRLILKLKSVV